MPTRVILFMAACSLLIAAGLPAPLPAYLAINHETKQCARFWGGDEYVTYELPSGWTAYEYQVSESGWFVETPAGTCTIPESEKHRAAQSCCEQLGYPYVSDNVGIRTLTPENMANRKAVEDLLAQEAAQAEARRLETIVLYAIVLVYVALTITTLAVWRQKRRKR